MDTFSSQVSSKILYCTPPPSTQLDTGRPELCRQRHTCPPLHGATEGGGLTGELDVGPKTNGIDRIQKASPSSSSPPVLPSPILPLSTLSHLSCSPSPSLFLLSYLPLLAASLSFLLPSVRKKKKKTLTGFSALALQQPEELNIRKKKKRKSGAML